MRPLARRGALLAGLIAVPALALGGAASGYWAGVGNGLGSSATGTTVAVTLGVGVPTADLYPGGSADVVLSIDNPNESPVRIGTLSLDASQGDGGFSVDGDHSACLVTALDFTTQDNDGAGWNVPPRSAGHDGFLAVTLTKALGMSVSAADACQGVEATVYLAAGP